MNRILQNIIAGILFITASVSLQAQVLVKASVDRDKILIGEPVILTLDVRTPLGQQVTWFGLDSLPHFEFIEKGKIDTTESVDGKKWLQQVIITSYDSGYWQVPMLEIKVGDKTYFSDSVGITVTYTPDDLSQEYRDIKEIEEVPAEGIGYIPWVIGGATLIAIGVIVFLFMRKKKTVTTPQAPVIKLTPYDEAMKAIEELRKSSLTSQEEVKIYYTKLNDVLRVFIMRKLNIATLEKTNDELVVELRKQRFQEDHFRELTFALQVADYVKFARYQPGTEDNEKNLTTIQSAIKTLNNIA